jgi:uroporphyrinogen-III decarboxylase
LLPKPGTPFPVQKRDEKSACLFALKSNQTASFTSAPQPVIVQRMTGKERVRAAIQRQRVDRVPLGFYAVDHDTIEKVIGRPTLVRNKVESQIAIWEGRRDDLVQSLKHDTVEFYRKVECADIILPKEAALVPPKDYTPDPPKQIGPDAWEDRLGRVIQANRAANDIMAVKTPPRPARTWSVEEFETPLDVHPPDETIFEAFDYVVEQLGAERYICAPLSGQVMPMLGSFEEAMSVYATQPEVIHAANARHVAIHAQTDRFYCRNGVSGCLMEQDMAGTHGPFISPAMWRELCLPYLKQRIASAKRFLDQVIYHCCGRTIPLLEMFIEAGVDCSQSLQTTAGMEIGKLRTMFGDRIAFWGGVPVELLIAGRPEEVRKSVRVAMERGASRGGFILGPSHSIAYGTKYENFMAMLDEYTRLRDKA